MSNAVASLIQAMLLFAAIFALTALGLALARKLRDRTVDDHSKSSELIANFRELHEQGGLSDEEFRTIKTKLAGELKTEINDNANAG